MQERRTAHRYRLPLTMEVKGVPIAGESGLLRAKMEDISTRGLYFTSDQRLAIGTRFNLSLTLPRELTQDSDVVIDAQARVVRVAERPESVVKRVGIAALIEKYNIIKTKPATT
jgi:c-di-GMP-binding flagellar brake protein YcgR